MVEEKRTLKQSASLHRYFRLIAEAMNRQGETLSSVLGKMREGVQIPLTENLIKEVLWRELQEHMFGKKSTRDLLKTGEIDKVIEAMTLFLSRFGISVEFPSIENQNPLNSK